MPQDDLRLMFSLDPKVAFLNHGSYGACPTSVLQGQQRFREQMEREPVRFMMRELEGLLDQARGMLAQFVGADPDDLAFVSNATTGVNTVLRSLHFEPGDELLCTNHVYNACKNALDFVAERTGANVVVADVPFPIEHASQVREAVVTRVSNRTQLALLEHITSPTALVLPIAELVADLAARGVDTLVDGAHAPGNIPLDVSATSAAYYVGNCHKWLCGPKGAAFLHVRCDRQAKIRPLVISHGANSPRSDRSRFRLEFDWPGTSDFSPFLAVPVAIRTMGQIFPGGWPELMARNRRLALDARNVLAETLGVRSPCPDSMIAAMASLPLPDGQDALLQDALFQEHAIEVPVFVWPRAPRRLLRISAQIYNQLSDYQRLASALKE